MALSRVKTWNAAETLTASDLNAEFNNVCNHFGSLDNDDIDSTASYVMGELIVGSGITSADGGQLHVHTGSAGTIQASGDADEAVFENSGASGVTILSGTTSTGNIAFGDSGDADNGLLKYTHGATPTLGITVDATAVQSIAAAATTLAHDLAVYQDANNADSQIALGTSATEALFVEALNGAGNKTLEELRFTTKTASGTANHGKMSWYVDEVNIGNVNDAGITLESGMIFAGNLTGNVTGNTSGTAATVTSGTQAAITTCANLTTVGTVGTGVWQGTAVASAYLDADTAHLSTTQTFTGAKTFTANVTGGVDGTGVDLKLFGDSPGAYLEWDQSADQLRILGPSADAAGSSGKLLLATAQVAVASGDILGQIDFQAPLETQGGDGALVSAAIKAVAQDTFTATVNKTDLIFYTGSSEEAAEKFRFTSDGELGVGGANYGTDGQVLTSAGAGAAAAWESVSAGVSLSGTTDGTIATVTGANALEGEANLTFDGSTLAVAGTASTSGNMGVGNADLGSTYFAGQHLLVGDEDASTGDASTAIVIATKVAGTGELNFTDNPTTAQQGSIWYDHSVDALILRANTGEKMRLLSSGGITFNGDTAAANALDDYEEGTFTPRLGAHSSDGTHSYTTQVGKYTKVGNMVSLWVRLAINTLNTSGTISGNLQIEDLPFTSANVTGQVYVGTFLPVGLDMDSGTGPVVTIGVNQSTMSLAAAVDNAGYDQFTSADVASGDEFWIQVNYPV